MFKYCFGFLSGWVMIAMLQVFFRMLRKMLIEKPA